MRLETQALLLDLPHCPLLRESEVNPAYACGRVVASRSVLYTTGNALDVQYARRLLGAEAPPLQMPEPWNGDLETAAVVFITSNASISFDKDFPTAAWEDDRVVAFFADRFGTVPHSQAPGGDRIRVHPAFVGAVYRRIPLKEVRWQRTLAIMKALAAELGAATPGAENGVTEVVHCKSRKQDGVTSARACCVERYAARVLAASGAGVLVFSDHHAKQAAATLLGAAFQHSQAAAPARRLHGPFNVHGR